MKLVHTLSVQRSAVCSRTRRALRVSERENLSDLLIGATARSTGAELVVTDSDFETEQLKELLTVTNLNDS